MEVDPLTLGLIVIILALCLRWRKRKLSVFSDLGIPGPKPSLICGNTFSIFRKNPIVCWREWARKYGKVYGWYLGFKPILYVSDPKLLKQMLIKDFQNFTDRPVTFGERPLKEYSHAITIERGEKWKKLRTILTPSFTTARMKTMTPLIDQAIDVLVEKLMEKSDEGVEFDIYDQYQMLTMDIIGRAAFGITTDVQRHPDNRLLALGKLFFSGNMQSWVLLLGTSFPEISMDLTMKLSILRAFVLNRGRRLREELIDLCEQVVKQRRENPELRRADLVQLMIDAEASYDGSRTDDKHLTAGEDDIDVTESKPSTDVSSGVNKTTKRQVHLTEKEVAINAAVFFLAGYETTSNLLAYTTYLLAKHPEIQEKARQEVLDLFKREGELKYESVNKLKYLEQVMLEYLRIYPPGYFFVNRECHADVTYGDIHIKKGMMVQVPVYQLHHDPEYWPNPDKFDPERFSPENRSKIDHMVFQAFGSGPRNCIGMRFAQMEAKMVFAQILRHFDLELSDRYQKAQLELKCGPITLTPSNGVYVKVKTRQ